MYRHVCTMYIHIRKFLSMYVHYIYMYVLVYTMLGWKSWFWKGFNASNNSLYRSDAYSNDPTIVKGWMLSNQCWVLEDVQTCLYHVHICKFLSMYMKWTGITYLYRHVCTITYLYVHGINMYIPCIYWVYIPVHVQTCLYMVQTCLYSSAKSCPGGQDSRWFYVNSK